MDLRETAEQVRFRAELRAWLSARLPAAADGPAPVGGWTGPATRAWLAELHGAGYAGLTWPARYGGRGLPISFQAIYLEEAARVGAGEHGGVIGLGMVGPTIIAVGTAGQKARYLPGILSGQVLFCQGFSEPEAGSDLAAVRTQATLDGDAFVVTGHKVWSSYAHLADRCLLLARTGPADSRHRGLTCLLVDLRAPGVTVRPLRRLPGDADFGEIVLDEVRVPRGDVLGTVGAGWSVAMTTLAHERGTFGFALTARLESQLRRLVATAHAAGRAGDPLLRDRIASVYVDLLALRWTSRRALSRLGACEAPRPESSIVKLRWSQANQRLTALALEVLGPDAALDGDAAYWSGFWQYHQLRSRANSLEGGTSEILRDVLAERVLALPRAR
ncbi:acyl-CoA dehydrogenase family protein [Micromonospora sp. CPCC 206061]|uniref:acyl-CoA dehydrogenase family protein n=1 Tax=Micromonospora sp. CPCC 206061 TaxID=3122410 RepID=UPI002FF26CED